MKKIFFVTYLLCCFVPLSFAALTLDKAKSEGLVGEKSDGYLGAVSSNPSAEVKALINDINAKRKAEYAKIQERNGVPIDQVEKLAAEKARERTASGQFIHDGSSWKKK